MDDITDASTRADGAASRGIIYIAAGEKYVRAANHSARSVRRTCPGLATHLFCDPATAAEADVFDGITEIPDPHRRSKVDYLSRTPFDRTLYLDTDTEIVADIRDIFDVLDRFDVGLAHAHSRNTKSTTQTWREALPGAFPQFNGGVILFRRNPRVQQFLDDWREGYHTAGFGRDQTTLRELLWLSDLRICTLPPEYNVRYEKYLEIWEPEEAQPKILHLRSYHGPKQRRRGLVGRTVGRLARAASGRRG